MKQYGISRTYVVSNISSLLLAIMVFLVFGAGACVLKATSNADNTSSSDQGISNETLILARQPAEFEQQEAVWLIWPTAAEYANGYSTEDVTLGIIDAVSPNTRIKLAVANEELELRAKSLIPDDILTEGRLGIYRIPSVDMWTRDMGPNFVVSSENKLIVVDFNFNFWGYAGTDDPDSQIEEKFDESVAVTMGIPFISTSMISEGGNREVNGKGTLMVVEAVELERNPDMTRPEIEAEFRRLLGVTKVIWLKEGVHDDDHTFRGPIQTENKVQAYTAMTTNGHVDVFARFASANTILLGEVNPNDLNDPVAQENYRRLEQNYHILKNATDQDGNPFRIVRMPVPKTILVTMRPGDVTYDFIKTLDYGDGPTFPDGQPVTVIAAASYLNFLITNGMVVGQKCWRKGMDESIKKRDQQALEVLQSVFPKREVVMLDALAVNLGGGGIHCITMQEPQAKYR